MENKTETFDPAKILNDAKDKLAKEKDLTEWPDWGKIPYSKWWLVSAMLDEAALLAISSVREECENKFLKEFEEVKGVFSRGSDRHNNALKEIELLKAALMEIDAAYWADPEPNYDKIEAVLKRVKAFTHK